MIHGYKRNKRQKSPQELEEEEELSKKISAKLTEFFNLPRGKVESQQLLKHLQFIALLMQLVSDIPTVFNFRRELVQQGIEELQPQEVTKLLGGQIKLTTKLIQSDPKSYTIWSYRQWLVKSLFKSNPEVIIAERQLTKGLLKKDEKNFHVWNYRNWLNSIQCSLDDQIQFTSKKIKANPFNFSPYHFRTKFICQKTNILLKGDLSSQEHGWIIKLGMTQEQFLSELETVKTAIFLNPNEEAPWLFYNWLLTQLVPAFVVLRLKKDQHEELKLNMKVGGFSDLIDGQNVSLVGESGTVSVVGESGKVKEDTWILKNSGAGVTVGSSLNQKSEVTLQSGGRLFLGDNFEVGWVKGGLKERFQQELTFLEEVIESQEQTKCRFTFLQLASICKLILQCGTSQSQHASTVQRGLRTIKAIQEDHKANKYICKQMKFWQRLERGELTVIEKVLKNRYP